MGYTYNFYIELLFIIMLKKFNPSWDYINISICPSYFMALLFSPNFYSVLQFHLLNNAIFLTDLEFSFITY